MSCLDFEFKRSKVVITVRPDMIIVK